jgi:hypothetical protein
MGSLLVAGLSAYFANYAIPDLTTAATFAIFFSIMTVAISVFWAVSRK